MTFAVTGQCVVNYASLAITDGDFTTFESFGNHEDIITFVLLAVTGSDIATFCNVDIIGSDVVIITVTL